MDSTETWPAQALHPQYGTIRFRWADDWEKYRTIYTVRAPHIQGSIRVGYDEVVFNEETWLPSTTWVRIEGHYPDRLTIHNGEFIGHHLLDLHDFRESGRFKVGWLRERAWSKSTWAKFEAVVSLTVSHWLSREADNARMFDRQARLSLRVRRHFLLRQLEDAQSYLARWQREEAHRLTGLELVNARLRESEPFNPE